MTCPSILLPQFSLSCYLALRGVVEVGADVAPHNLLGDEPERIALGTLEAGVEEERAAWGVRVRLIC